MAQHQSAPVGGYAQRVFRAVGPLLERGGEVGLRGFRGEIPEPAVGGLRKPAVLPQRGGVLWAGREERDRVGAGDRERGSGAARLGDPGQQQLGGERTVERVGGGRAAVTDGAQRLQEGGSLDVEVQHRQSVVSMAGGGRAQ
ncbi:hypothetical protein [Streptomyces sp. NPDC004976]